MAAARPLHDNAWLLFAEGDRDVGGLTVPAGDPPRWMDATVVALGPDVPDGLGIGVGDVVIANLYDGVPVEHEGRIYRCVPASKILAALEA